MNKYGYLKRAALEAAAYVKAQGGADPFPFIMQRFRANWGVPNLSAIKDEVDRCRAEREVAEHINAFLPKDKRIPTWAAKRGNRRAE